MTAARPALWSVHSVYPFLPLITAAIDEVKEGRLVPGVEQLDQRFLAHHSQANAAQDPEAGKGDAAR